MRAGLRAPAATSATSRRVLADGWYSWLIPSFRPLTDLIGRWPQRLQDLSWRLGWFRALALVLAGCRYEVIAVVRASTGWRSTLLLRALFGRRRKLVVLQFIDLPRRSAGVGAAVDSLWRPVERWAVGRAVLRAQVLSPLERKLYPLRFDTEPERFCVLPFAWRFTPRSAPPPRAASTRHGVVSAGRAMCDWPTLFAAAQGASWPLLVICGTADRSVVEQLNHDNRATVMCDVEREQTLELLRSAEVCVLPLIDSPISHGQIRLCDAADTGAAVVATRIPALEGYVDDGHTAMLVGPRDPAAMRQAIEDLLGDSRERDRLAQGAFTRAADWTWEDYLKAVDRFVHTGETVTP